MTLQDLAYRLGSIRDNLGIVEGFALAMKEALDREVDSDHFSEAFIKRFETATKEIRESTDACYEAIHDLPTGFPHALDRGTE